MINHPGMPSCCACNFKVGPGTIGNPIGNTMGNSIGNSIGNILIKIYIKIDNKYMLKNNMGPMGPRGLGPWALWAPGALGPK